MESLLAVAAALHWTFAESLGLGSTFSTSVAGSVGAGLRLILNNKLITNYNPNFGKI
jgi:hypothetical protein